MLFRCCCLFSVRDWRAAGAPSCRHTKKQQQYRKWQFNSIWRKTNIKHFFLLSLHHVLLNYFLPSLLFTERDRRRVRDRKKISAIGNCSLSIGFFFFRSKIVKWISTLFRCVSFELSFNGKSFLSRNQFSIFFLHFDALECLIIPKQLTKISLWILCLFKCVCFFLIYKWKSFSISEKKSLIIWQNTQFVCSFYAIHFHTMKILLCALLIHFISLFSFQVS